MNTPQENAQLAVSPVNRRITWLILGFAFLSLMASVLPLVPGVGKILPFELLERRGALTLYAVFIVSYMAMIFPTTLLATHEGASKKEKSRQALGWWWVGAFMLAFSGVPLFVLAYIAGVSLKGVFAILLWAGVFHGVVTLWPRLFGYRSRAVLVIGNFLLLAIVPTMSRFSELLGMAPRANSPMSTIIGITRDFTEPDLITPLVLMSFVYLALWAICFFKQKKVVASAALILAATVTLGFSHMDAGSNSVGTESVQSKQAEALALTQDYHVEGRVFPLRLTGAAEDELIVKIGGRDEIRWTVPSSGPRSTWVYPTLQAEDNVIAISNGAGRTIAEINLRPLDSQKSLVLFLSTAQQANAENWIAVQHPGLVPPISELAYDPFGAVVCAEHFYRALKGEQKQALDAWSQLGGALILLESRNGGLVKHGRGTIQSLKGKQLPPGLQVPLRARHADDANLYSDFLLPDWGQVDLSGLLLFLGIYHAVFYVIFLLPLVFDAKKSLTVYLCSVGFVLTICVGGAYYTLKQVFLTENQILQQNLCTWRLPIKAGENMQLEQESCFASFNGQAGSLEFEITDAPRLVHVAGTRQSAKMRLSPAGTQLKVMDLKLDRFAGKQVLRLTKNAESPFNVEAKGRSVKIRPRPGVKDPFGLLTAKIRSAFYRFDGRLYPAEIRGNTFHVQAEPDSLIWQGVIPQDLRDANVMPFLRYSLGRHAGRKENVLVILLEGAQSLHAGEKYLARRDILQVILIGVDLPAK